MGLLSVARVYFSVYWNKDLLMWLLTYEAKQGSTNCVPNQDDNLCASQSVTNPLVMCKMKLNLILHELE